MVKKDKQQDEQQEDIKVTQDDADERKRRQKNE